jgi:hypothetical protein
MKADVARAPPRRCCAGRGGRRRWCGRRLGDVQAGALIPDASPGLAIHRRDGDPSGEITLVTIGPLTNLALALEAAIARLVKKWS